MKKIIGKAIQLTKNIWLIEPAHERGFLSQFSPGKSQNFVFSAGVFICWWHTKSGVKITEELASMLICYDKTLASMDHKSAIKIINSTLNEICIDDRLFNSNQVCFRGNKTLFECRAKKNTEMFGELIVNEMFSRLKQNIEKWCTSYIAPRISGNTFNIAIIGITAIAKPDKESWKNTVEAHYKTDYWQSEFGVFPQGKNIDFSRLKYSYIFISENIGTQDGCKFSAQINLRKLFAVIYALASSSTHHCFQNCAAAPNTYTIQFPDINSTSSITISEIGQLAPYNIENIPLSDNDIKDIQNWFEQTDNLPQEQSNRIDKCAHFINRAMNSEDLESYINFFIALDALFGKRGSVEASIIRGIEKIPKTNRWQEKISWLFELRSELVHGGCKSIVEWPRYHNYYQHFDSTPSADIEKMAFCALLSSPKIIG